MLTDSDSEVRKEAVVKLLAARNGKKKKPRSRIARGIRFFQPPLLNWNSTSYTKMIDLKSKKVIITEPPVISHLSDDELKAACASPLDLPKYPTLHYLSHYKC